MNKNKLLLALGVVVLIVAFFAFDLGRYFSLAYLKSSQARFAALYESQPALVIGAYLLVYVAATALSLPGAAILTLAAGAMFGLLVGTVIVSFASSIGATLAFLAARFLLRDSVQCALRRAPGRDRQGRAEGGRVLPLHAAPGAAGAVLRDQPADGPDAHEGWAPSTGSASSACWPARVVYVNAGTQLAQDRLAAGHPVAGADRLVRAARRVSAGRQDGARRGARRARSMRVGASASRRRFDRNLVVIGAGAAGLVSSYIAAAVKAKVTLVEGHKMGGDCLNYGCVPSKALIKTAKLMHQMRHSAHLRHRHGAGADVDFADVMERVRRVIREIEPHDSVERYTGLGVDVVLGQARILDPWHVRDRPRPTAACHADDAHHRRRHRRRAVRAAAAGPATTSAC